MIKEAFSEHKNNIKLATSSGSSILPIGIFEISISITSLGGIEVKSVLISAGATELTRIPYFTTSIVVVEFGKPLQIRDYSIPDVKPNGILVKVEMAVVYAGCPSMAR